VDALWIDAICRAAETSASSSLRGGEIIVADGGASLQQAAALGAVRQGAGMGQRGQDFLFRVAEAAVRRIRGREIEQPSAAAPVSFECQGEAVGFEAPICA
jgi:hypothetical protein